MTDSSGTSGPSLSTKMRGNPNVDICGPSTQVYILGGSDLPNQISENPDLAISKQKHAPKATVLQDLTLPFKNNEGKSSSSISGPNTQIKVQVLYPHARVKNIKVICCKRTPLCRFHKVFISIYVSHTCYRCASLGTYNRH